MNDSRHPPPIPMLLTCPASGCGRRHIDSIDYVMGIDWSKRPHKVHACQHCGHVWQPALVDTVGVQFLPGYKNDAPQEGAPEKCRQCAHGFHGGRVCLNDDGDSAGSCECGFAHPRDACLVCKGPTGHLRLPDGSYTLVHADEEMDRKHPAKDIPF